MTFIKKISTIVIGTEHYETYNASHPNSPRASFGIIFVAYHFCIYVLIIIPILVFIIMTIFSPVKNYGCKSKS